MPFSQKDPLVGLVVDAVIIRQHPESCDLKTPEGKLLRLYKSDSRAWQDDVLLTELTQYAEGRELRVRVLYLRADGELYFVNERWISEDYWESLDLRVGDVVKGRVLSPVRRKASLLGYFVQLYPGLSGYYQPDMRIYLPVNELPWANGSIDDEPSDRSIGRFDLWEGDWVELEIIHLHELPQFPEASLVKRFWVRDSEWLSEASQHSFLQGQNSHESTQTDGSSQTMLAGKRILLVDDTFEKLQSLKRTLQKNGATVEAIHAKYKTLTELAGRVRLVLIEEAFDLALIDYALPHPYQGLQLIEQVHAATASIVQLPLFVLLSTYLEERDIAYARKKLPYLKGFIVRPIQIDQVQKLCAGEEVWRGSPQYQAIANATNPRKVNIIEVMRELYIKERLRFIVLLSIGSNQQLVWHSCAGSVPFVEDDLDEVAQHTDLHTLIEGSKTEHHVLVSQYTVDRVQISYINEKAHWYRLAVSGQQVYLLGIGSLKQTVCAELIFQLVQQCLVNAAWESWAIHHANFISSGALVHSLAHEYRNYLGHVSMLGQTMQKAVRMGSVDDFEALVQDLNAATQGLSNLTNTLLQGLSYRRTSTSLKQIIQQAEQLVSPVFKEYKVDLEIYQVPDMELGIPSALVLVPLVNLLINGAKHHYRDDLRFVSLSVSIALSDGQKKIRLSVRDNGPGIHEQVIPTLFQLGFSDAVEKDKQHGIGLWLSNELARKGQGKIELLDNLRGLGCHFSLILPLNLETIE